MEESMFYILATVCLSANRENMSGKAVKLTTSSSVLYLYRYQYQVPSQKHSLHLGGYSYCYESEIK